MYDVEVGGAGSIKELAAAISCLQVAPVAKDVEELLAQRDRLDAKISGILRVFEAELGWAEDGSLSLTAWLAAHGRGSRKEAHREAVISNRLSQLPVTAAAWAEGVLSSSQVGAVVANVSQLQMAPNQLRVPRSFISPRPWTAGESFPGTFRPKMPPWSKQLLQLPRATSTRPSCPCRAPRNGGPLRSSMSAGGSWTTAPRFHQAAATGRTCRWWSA